MVHSFSTRCGCTRSSRPRGIQCSRHLTMTVARLRVGLVAFLTVACVEIATPALAQTSAAPTLFRVFLNDGSSVVSYGEFARVDDEVVFSMPLGAPNREPRLQLITLPASLVNWQRTDRYALSARYQRYAATRGEADFAALSAEVAAMLNQIASTTEKARTLEIAAEARRLLVAWPATHFGYRQSDVTDIVTLIDEAVSGLSTTDGSGSVELSLIAPAPSIEIEPVLGMTTPRDQVTRLVTLASLVPRAADRTTLLRAALNLLKDPSIDIPTDDVGAARRSLESRLREEAAVDAQYARLSKRLADDARRAAGSAYVGGVERALGEVDRQDVRLGGKRPETISALKTEVAAQLEAARDLRLRRDQWLVRQRVYREYVDSVSAQVLQLVKAQSSLDAIRRLAGPSPSRLATLKDVLNGGADRLQRMGAPDQMQVAHELLVTAWRFAENAAATRYTAVVSGDLATAWQASSAAAGSLLLLGRAQAELRSALEPPRLR